MKDSKNLFRKLSIIGIGLCAACCLLPIAAVTFGVGAFTVLSAYLEWTGIAAMVLAVISFGVYYLRKRQAPACDIDCACKEENTLSKAK
jgi:hypothetical protein